MSVRIPVVVACALEEGRHIKTEVADACVEAILQAGFSVAEFDAVTGVVYSVLAEADVAAAVNVEIFDVAGLPAAVDTLGYICEIDF